MASSRNPLVTITIPTYNSAETLDRCLTAIEYQTYKNSELSIVDSASTDATLDIVARHGVGEIYQYKGGLLGARKTGIMNAKGRYVLLLDSDQILERDAIKRAVLLCETDDYDMVALEEDVASCTNIIEWLFSMDRRLIHKIANLDPATGVILPRLFRTSVIKIAIRAIPNDIVPSVGGPDHAIIYYECCKLSRHVALLPKAVWHIEPNSLRKIWQKFYRWGYTSASAKNNEKYRVLLSKKERFRTGLFSRGLWVASIASILLIIIKGIPYKIGYIKAATDRKDIT